VQDLKVAIHNLKSVSQKISAGEGTLGALVADPTVYERLVTILEGAQRSFLLRSLIRSLGETGAESRDEGARR
jgi:phospholipid/cholesterol/gamma-HCH transport system substrate-binding protein